jgi:hypothetical protein
MFGLFQKHKKLIQYIGISVGVVGVVSVAGVVYYYPELRETPIGALKASKRLWNVTYAGAKIAWIYKMDSADMGVKHDRASKILKDAFY